ncbi:MAG: sensor histidine kinase [Christensenellaceae bacterium]|jgi:signal transduction histidine kinase
MNIGKYLKDCYPYVLAAVALVVFVGIFLSAFKIPPHAILFVAALMMAVFLFVFFREYGKRKKYYDNLLDMFERLDKKYLISELMEEGDFADSGIFYDILKQSNKSMNDEVAAQRLKAADYAEFLEGWVHEIKTPIASARLAAQNNPGEVTGRMDEDLERIERYVQNVLFYARSSIVEKDYMIKKTDLDTIVRQALRENSRALIENKISVDMDSLHITAFTDEKWVLFILSQIIMNSVKYKREEGARLVFRGEDSEAGAVLHIIDNGIGIPSADLPRIFEKGFTGENGRKFAKSTGIGLFLCKKLCKKLGIGISARSEDGTEIVLAFPKTDMFFRT